MPFRIFVDTEFTDLLDCELLSIGLVAEDGREFYAERSDVDLERCGDFARVAVLPQLRQDGSEAFTEEELGSRVREWLAQFQPVAPVLISVDHPVDWELCSYLVRDPESLVMPTWVKGQSIRGAIDPLLIELYWTQHGRRSHHALHDARANRFAFLQGREDSMP